MNFRRNTSYLFGCGSLALIVQGCAGVDPRPAFVDVSKTVSEHSGQPLHWTRDSKETKQSKQRTDELLKNKLTPESAVEVMLLSNPTVQATLEEIGISQADLAQATRPSNPVIDGEVRFKGPKIPYEIVLRQDIMGFLLLPAKKKTASLGLESTKLRVAQQVLNLASDVQKAFYELQAAEQVLLMHQEIAQATASTAELARRQHEAGNINDLELDMQQSLNDQARIDLNRAEIEVKTARETLHRLLGVGNRASNWTLEARIPNLPPKENDLSAIKKDISLNRLDLAAAQKEIDATKRSISLARYSAWPNLYLGVHYEREPEGIHTVGPALGISLPIFDWGQASVARAKSKLRQAEEQYQALSAAVESEVRLAHEKLETARKNVELYQGTVLPRQKRIVEEMLLHYNAMLHGVYQLLQARQNQTLAQRNLIEAQRDYWIARVELTRATGERMSYPAEETK